MSVLQEEQAIRNWRDTIGAVEIGWAEILSLVIDLQDTVPRRDIEAWAASERAKTAHDLSWQLTAKEQAKITRLLKLGESTRFGRELLKSGFCDSSMLRWRLAKTRVVVR